MNSFELTLKQVISRVMLEYLEKKPLHGSLIDMGRTKGDRKELGLPLLHPKKGVAKDSEGGGGYDNPFMEDIAIQALCGWGIGALKLKIPFGYASAEESFYSPLVDKLLDSFYAYKSKNLDLLQRKEIFRPVVWYASKFVPHFPNGGLYDFNDFIQLLIDRVGHGRFLAAYAKESGTLPLKPNECTTLNSGVLGGLTGTLGGYAALSKIIARLEVSKPIRNRLVEQQVAPLDRVDFIHAKKGLLGLFSRGHMGEYRINPSVQILSMQKFSIDDANWMFFWVEKQGKRCLYIFSEKLVLSAQEDKKATDTPTGTEPLFI